MATKHDVTDWVVSALKRQEGRGSLIDVARDIWGNHESEIRSSGDLFFTWQYDMRWSATMLRRKGIIKAAEASPRGIWELA
ncbi:MAG: hypothetical protein RBR34_02810 [Rhodospirillaceae bacterium]|nr:hypothetical protein [Rhodospirillaceae bacterium]